jgi:hypothetical protein
MGCSLVLQSLVVLELVGWLVALAGHPHTPKLSCCMCQQISVSVRVCEASWKDLAPRCCCDLA